MKQQTAVMIGAGPAGLTAAYELLKKTDIRPIVYERTGEIGGLCKTVNYKGNRIDIGGHRFFSKSDRVLAWWDNILPLQSWSRAQEKTITLQYQGKKRILFLDSAGPNPEKTDKVMLIRRRLSRIYFQHHFYDYPLSFNLNLLFNLGVVQSSKFVLSYFHAQLFPIKPEQTLRDFLINRFGRELYFIFFKSYTEKVWGVPCRRISAQWGAQRIKGLSLLKALFGRLGRWISQERGVLQKQVETSLIEWFLYPKYGPGQMWEEVARLVQEQGGEIRLQAQVVKIKFQNNRIVAIEIKNPQTGQCETQPCDFLFSSMPVQELIQAFDTAVPSEIEEIAQGLQYRAMITVGVLLKKIQLHHYAGEGDPVVDNWIYIQEKSVKVGRIQIFNNWSPYLVQDPQNVWIGMEYFVSETDALWSQSDEQIQQFSAKELSQLRFAEQEDILDQTVLRAPKAYPAYFGTYDRFAKIQEYTNQFENLFLIGRNGMHCYNNQDHSMLTAMAAVENIVQGIPSKEAIWAINTEEDYHENIS